MEPRALTRAHSYKNVSVWGECCLYVGCVCVRALCVLCVCVLGLCVFLEVKRLFEQCVHAPKFVVLAPLRYGANRPAQLEPL